MALNSDALLKIGTGAFYTAPIGTAIPTRAELQNPGEAWTHMGHTPIDDILNSSTEGGDVTQHPTLQAPSGARSTASARTVTYNISLHQFDEESLLLYWGSNSTVNAEGGIEVAEVPEPSELAWLFVFRDGSRVGGVHAERSSVIGSGDFSLSDTESMATLPLSITPMVLEGSEKNSPFTFYPPEVFDGGVTPGE